MKGGRERTSPALTPFVQADYKQITVNKKVLRSKLTEPVIFKTKQNQKPNNIVFNDFIYRH